jgi:two-component system, OmpR family, response regulator RstA
MPGQTLLLVEDDAALAALVSEYLGKHGYIVSLETTAAGAMRRIPSEQPSAVILDLTLPDGDGLDVCRHVRDVYDGPILMMTARGDEIDQVVGLEIGADDYLAKPASPRLLLARIRALLRQRDRIRGDPESFSLDGLIVDRTLRTASFNGEPVPLTTAEFDLLWYLARHAGEPVQRDTLFEEIRGIRYNGIDRAIDVMVSRLRRKLPGRIRTVRSVGYLLTKVGE